MSDSAMCTEDLPLVYVCFALDDEAVEIRLPQARCKRLITGIGKVRSTLSLTKAIMEERPAAVINVGTAGSVSHRIGDIVVSRSFRDRDHAGLRLPGLLSEVSTARIPVCPHLYSVLNGKTEDNPHVVNTGDDFVTAAKDSDGDAFDMEAFAEAWVCRQMGIPFVSVKFVTDIIGRNSVRQWEEKLAEARAGLATYFVSMCGRGRN